MQPDHHPQPHTPPPTIFQKIKGMFATFFNYWLVSWVLIPVLLVFVLHHFVFSAYHVVGTSMVPTLSDSDYLIVSKVAHSVSDLGGKPYIPKRGQIIVFHYPKQPTLDFVKRVTGTPGDRVVVQDCKVTVYTSEKPEGYNPDASHQISGSCTEGSIDMIIPNKTVFVLGDNRTPGGSSDSREWGLLPSNDIIGNVKLRLLPLSNIKLF